jgi:HEAT repeat protein
VEYVRKILDSDVDEVWRLKYKLLELGPKAFPVYEKLLADPKTNSGQVSRIFSVLREVPGDRSRFLETAIKNLTSPSFSVRYSAIRLLGAIGSHRDTAPIVASLYDKDIGIISAAAETLAEIGGRRELVAFDVWLRASKARGIGKPLIDMLRKHRDALEFRLKLKRKTRRLRKGGRLHPSLDRPRKVPSARGRMAMQQVLVKASKSPSVSAA